MYDSPCEIFETGILKRSAKVLIHPEVYKEKKNDINTFKILICYSYLFPIEEEKMEILQHYENFRKVNSGLEEQVGKLLRDKAKLEVEVASQSTEEVVKQ